ncbi:AraC family transcriptional regulator [Bacteroidales bacterium]|nr:AraC family transcriptional regulator [Bacteroidales bacterium]
MKKIPEIIYENYNPKTQGFELIKLSELFVKIKKPIDHNPHLPHKLSFNIILIITSGETTHLVDFNKHHLKAGDSLLISKGQMHAFNTLLKFDGYIIVFTEAFMQKFVAQSALTKISYCYNYFLRQEKIYAPLLHQQFIKIFREEVKINTSNISNILGAYLSIFLIKLSDQSLQNTPQLSAGKNYDYFIQFKKLVETNFSKTRDAKDYAHEICISYKHLNTVSKNVIGITAKSFIDNFVILEAKRMLVSTVLSVKEIAFKIGFEEPTNFQKYFKKHTQLTPAVFRKNIV